MTVDVDAAAVVGFLLAAIRLSAFVVASPILSRTVPLAGRIAFVVGLGLFFAEPTPAAVSLGPLIVAAAANIAVGVVLGFTTGLIFHLFAVGGGLIDDTSGLRAGALLDPLTGTQATVFSRSFQMTALALFLVIGGDRLVVRGLATAFAAVPVGGAPHLAGGFADASVTLIGRMMIAALELAMPAVAALFAAEVVLGIATRFAPRANVFLIGLPVKILTAMTTVWLVLALVPETLSGTMRIVERTFIEVVDVLGR